jgi:phenylpropionate dioxygenase-like ring-hydroxylating dioxygenase large terminal subunit
MQLDSSAPLREMWYYALPGKRLKRRRMIAKTILGEPLLLGRTADGTVFALRDICPHRGIPLSYGSFDGREVACCYHGWRFNSDGQCTAIPSLTVGQDFDLTRIRVKRYPAVELQGNIWVYFGDDPASAPPLPELEGVGARGYDLIESALFSCTIDHAVVGLMDPAHGPFVHRAWWWRSARSIHEKVKAFAATPYGFTMLPHSPSKNSRAYRLLGGKPETEIIFRLPSTRIERVRIGQNTLYNLTAITPLTEHATEINNALYWTMPWLTMLKPLLRPFVRAFLLQDRDIMAKQEAGLRYEPTLLFINDADTQARWYFRLKKEYARARAEDRPFVNPIPDSVLRWRS